MHWWLDKRGSAGSVARERKRLTLPLRKGMEASGATDLSALRTAENDDGADAADASGKCLTARLPPEAERAEAEAPALAASIDNHL